MSEAFAAPEDRSTLKDLAIRNVGGVSRCELSLKSGFTVITGESGAGKSSIVRAIELAAGKRAQSSFIRAGEEEASVDAVFATDTRLPGLDDELQPVEGSFFAKRALSRSGRGRASLQGVSVPLNIYSSSTSHFIHIQSQFAQMELLDTDRQLAMVDSCGGTELAALLRELREVFAQARQKERELKDIADRRAEIEQKYANAAEVVPLVKKVNPTEGLEASLDREIDALSRRLAAASKVAQNLDRLSGGLSEQGLLDELEGVCEALIDCTPPEVAGECTRLLREGMQSFHDLVEAALRQTGRSPDALAQEIEELEGRRGELRRLRRLAGAKSEDELLAWCAGAVEGLSWLEESYDRLEQVTREARELRRQASHLALSIREYRKRAASELGERVNALFADLAMDGIGFAITFVELPRLRRDGADGVEFTLFTSKRSGRVDKIASGGELSRLLLALQLSLPDEWLPPTLVFDEVEAGLGGRAAVLSGLKLQELSQKCQVLLVTHEASIAALGDEHCVVRKITREGGPESLVLKVEGEDRVRELARMLSGNPDLPEAQDHARKLLEEAQNLRRADPA
ncbi:MAG: AAA family ATPase [Synergistaceae bacterium]|jgi:DNA repair protein RecN (Recombination protein N)|nr:AAA family ATPase [Synergistaceae bacterium]